jgi:HD superfamily phosphohydrolase
MSTVWCRPFLDPLHGPIEFDETLLALVRSPVVQRLRHVRLSNIDSVDMPAIANLTRFEHVLGVAYLAGEVGFRAGISANDDLVLRGSALLHDWAITAFGHLVEEALQYVGVSVDHEEKLSKILTGQGSEDIGCAGQQILLGRETGMNKWAYRAAGADGERLLTDIMNHIRGRGRMGRVIAGDIDLDNIDNVFRMAFHMGLPIDREIPRRIAAAMVGLSDERGEPVLRASAQAEIHAWRETRRQVYEHLMLAEQDFIGKLMVLFATVRAYEQGEITPADWSLMYTRKAHATREAPMRDQG